MNSQFKTNARDSNLPAYIVLVSHLEVSVWMLMGGLAMQVFNQT